MPTSAPGSKPVDERVTSVSERTGHPRDSQAARRHAGSAAQAGFTLLEMLVVLVIAGLLVSLASLQLTRNPRTDLNEEAQRLALLFESAGDEAQVRARPIAWQPLDGGFRFDVRTEDGWRPLRDDLLARAPLGRRRDRRDDPVPRLRQVGRAGSCSAPKPSTRRWKSRWSRPPGRATIVGTGNGRYQVR